MTDRRPDVCCSGCTKYLYSLSHNPDKWPKGRSDEYCDSCKEQIRIGIFTGSFLTRLWWKGCDDALARLKKSRKLSPAENELIEEFRKHGSWGNSQLKLPGTRDGLSAENWRHYGSTCLAELEKKSSNPQFRNRKTAEVLREYVSA